MQEENKKDKKKDKKKENGSQSQVLIEDGTMAEFGYNNPCEVQVTEEDKRKV